MEKVKESANTQITTQFEQACDEIIDHLDESSFLIDVETVQQANNLVEYLNLNKLVLSGYDIETKDDYDCIIEKLLSFNKIVKPEAVVSEQHDKEIFYKILQNNSMSIASNQLTRNGFKIKDIKSAFERLEKKILAK